MAAQLPPPLPPRTPVNAAPPHGSKARSNWIAGAVVAGVAGGGWLLSGLDGEYSRNAPYRRTASQSSSDAMPEAPSRFDAPAPAPMPEPVPLLPEAATGMLKDADPAPPQRADMPPLAFPVRSTTIERQPRGTRARVLAEVRWCMFNEVRLQGARSIGSAAQLQGLQAAWHAACDGDEARPRDVQQVQGEVGHGREKLEAEGRAMLPARDAGR